MKVEIAKVHPGKPLAAPRVVKPVWCYLESRVYYVGGSGRDETRSLYCAEAFARLVLGPMDEWAKRHGFGLLHLGCYAPRQARKANGQIIKPARWSTHSYGLGIDWAGIVDGRSQVIRTPAMRTACPAKLQELVEAVRASIAAGGRRAEIVEEPTWWHLGIWP